eukprot:4912040-Pleurochrysis_carterae.AAC.2
MPAPVAFGTRLQPLSRRCLRPTVLYAPALSLTISFNSFSDHPTLPYRQLAACVALVAASCWLVAVHQVPVRIATEKAQLYLLHGTCAQ